MILVNATSVSIDNIGVLIMGPTGSGKSSLALELIAKGGVLISDDITLVEEKKGVLYASPAPNILGLLEVRGIGIVSGIGTENNVPVKVVIDLTDEEPRYVNELKYRSIHNVLVPLYQFKKYGFSLTNKVMLAISIATNRMSVIERD